MLADRVFTGDTLLIRGTGRTDFQNGDPRAQYNSIFNRLLKLPDATMVFPAHDYKGDTVSTIGEERQFNPRLKVKSMDEYAALMNGLNLPNPKMMDVAVPANMRVGLHQDEVARRGWALSAADAVAIEGNPDIAIVDLREEGERERHGVIPGSLHAPYSTCRSMSARAACCTSSRPLPASASCFTVPSASARRWRYRRPRTPASQAHAISPVASTPGRRPTARLCEPSRLHKNRRPAGRIRVPDPTATTPGIPDVLPTSEPAIRTIAMPADTNPHGDIFGGWLLCQMDLAGSTVATRRANGRVVTVAITAMAFHRPVLVGDEVIVLLQCRENRQYLDRRQESRAGRGAERAARRSK